MEKGSELLIKTRNLEELNTALRVMLQQRTDDREELERTLMNGVKSLIMPHLVKLRKEGSERRREIYSELIASNLDELFSHFSQIIEPFPQPEHHRDPACTSDQRRQNQ